MRVVETLMTLNAKWYNVESTSLSG